MKKYILVYYGMPDFKSAESARKHQEMWKEWSRELGSAIVEPGTPAKPGKNVSAKRVTDADGADRFNGYTIVQADSLDEAVEFTRRCPFVVDGGTMGVHEMGSMGM